LDESAHASLAASCEELRARTGNPPLVEVERILNDRPLNRNQGQVCDLDPLTPSKLLLLRSNSCLPTGVFVDEDRYSKRWRQAQLLANTFWKRWLGEYLPSLQQRQKWLKPRRNLKVKDLVLMVVRDVHQDSGLWRWSRKFYKDGMVRQVVIIMLIYDKHVVINRLLLNMATCVVYNMTWCQE
jgi:hypothetical protein